MSISSRTPEGQPLRCPLCGKLAAMEVSPVTGDATCPACGELLWDYRDLITGWREFLAEQLGVAPERITLDTSLTGGLCDSLDTMEMIMELEEELGVSISDADLEQILTLRDLLRWLKENRRPDDS